MDFFLVQVFQVRKVSGATSGKIFAMKVLKKVSFNIIQRCQIDTERNVLSFLIMHLKVSVHAVCCVRGTASV